MLESYRYWGLEWTLIRGCPCERRNCEDQDCIGIFIACIGYRTRPPLEVYSGSRSPQTHMRSENQDHFIRKLPIFCSLRIIFSLTLSMIPLLWLKSFAVVILNLLSVSLTGKHAAAGTVAAGSSANFVARVR